MDELLVVFSETFGIILFFVVGRSKLAKFLGQILNSIVTIILERKEYDHAHSVL